MMRSSMTFTYDDTEVRNRLSNLDAAMPGIVKAALSAAGTQLMRDTLAEYPLVPIDVPGQRAGTSDRELAGSAAVFSVGDKVAGSDTGDRKYQPDSDDGLSTPASTIVVFGAPYAALWHELRPTGSYARSHGIFTTTGYTRSGSDLQFLRTHLYAGATKYLGIMTGIFRSQLGRTGRTRPW